MKREGETLGAAEMRNGSFGEFVRTRRREKGWTVKEFIEKLEASGYKRVSPAYITRVEQYGEIPSPETICEFAAVLQCPVDELIALAKEGKINKLDRMLDEKYREAVGLYRTQKKKD